jgi:hypothetical protein
MSDLIDHVGRNPIHDEESIVKYWCGIFGEYIEESQYKTDICLTMDEAAKYIFSLPHYSSEFQSFGEREAETTIIPIIVRIMRDGRRITSVESLYNDIVQYFNLKQPMFDEFRMNGAIDIEAELTAKFAEEYVGITSDGVQPIKTFKRHRF